MECGGVGWSVECGGECGVCRSVKCGVQSLKCGVQSVNCGV